MKRAGTTWTIRFCAALLLSPAALGSETPPVFPPRQMARIQQGLRDLYNMDYDRATSAFHAMTREAPEDPAGFVYLAMTYYVQELFQRQELTTDRFAASDFFVENPRYAPKTGAAMEALFRQTSQQALEKAGAALARNPNDRAGLFLRGLAHQNLASFEVSQQNWWPAVRHGRMTLRDHRELLRQVPTFADARLAVGVCDYAAGSLPWTVRWIAVFLGYPGSKERGRRELETAAAKGLLVADDARVVLVLIYTLEKQYEKASRLLSELHQKYPQNYLAHLDLGGLALLRGQHDLAVDIYRDILLRQEGGQPKYGQLERAALYNRLGVAFRRRGDTAESAAMFQKALEEERLSERSSTIARLELGKTLDLMGRRQEALSNYRQVAAAQDFAGTRVEAQQLLRRPYRD
jgi:tetratricopeptide (TPR) repeat protein